MAPVAKSVKKHKKHESLGQSGNFSPESDQAGILRKSKGSLSAIKNLSLKKQKPISFSRSSSKLLKNVPSSVSDPITSNKNMKKLAWQISQKPRKGEKPSASGPCSSFAMSHSKRRLKRKMQKFSSAGQAIGKPKPKKSSEDIASVIQKEQYDSDSGITDTSGDNESGKDRDSDESGKINVNSDDEGESEEESSEKCINETSEKERNDSSEGDDNSEFENDKTNDEYLDVDSDDNEGEKSDESADDDDDSTENGDQDDVNETSEEEEIEINSSSEDEHFSTEEDTSTKEEEIIFTEQCNSKSKKRNNFDKKTQQTKTNKQERGSPSEKQNSGKIVAKEDNKCEETKFVAFITNLPYTATEADVREHFKDVPCIKSISIMKDKKTGKSLGRATMEVGDYVSYAFALSLHKVNMNNRPLSIVPDKSMPKGISKGLIQSENKKDGQDLCRLCVTNIPASANIKEIKQHFSSLGSVKRFIIPPFKKQRMDEDQQRTMILVFDDYDVFKKFLDLDGSVVLGHPLSIKPLSQNSCTKIVKKRKADETESHSSVKKAKAEESPQCSNENNKTHQFAIFVDSIPLSATKTALKSHFEEAGEVVECRIREPPANSKRSSKSAYVRMVDQESFENALSMRDKKFVDHRLIIEAFRKKSAMKKRRFVVFVGNIPFASSGDDVKKHFNDIGNILDVRLPLNKENKPQGYAYVEFADQASYEKSLTLHHSFLKGRRINVYYSTSKRSSGENKARNSTVKQKLFKLQTLSQKQHLQQKSPFKKRRSKPGQKKRRARQKGND